VQDARFVQPVHRRAALGEEVNVPRLDPREQKIVHDLARA